MSGGQVELLTSLKDRLYRGPVEATVRRLGSEGMLRDWYWDILLALSSDRISVNVGEVNATFLITTPAEHWLYRKTDIGNEREMITHLLRYVRTDDVVFDIGANVGTYTCFLSQKIDIGTVVAFEPHPANAERLRKNLELNDTVADVRECAVSNRMGTGELTTSETPTADGNHSLVTNGSEQTIEIELCVGDELVQSHRVPTPDVLKIDVEGAELDVIDGLEETLAAGSCRALYCEVHPTKMDSGASPDDLYERLRNHGFEVKTLKQRGTTSTIFAERIDSAP